VALGDFLSAPAQVAQAAAGLSGPIFTFGGIQGQVESAEAGEHAALAFYQQSVQNAFRETNDALVGSEKSREESAALAERVASLREYARLSRLRFDNGYASYLEVLYAENELFGAELTSVVSRADHYTQLVNVYKAVGGGWLDEADKLAPKPLAGTKPD
jgi:multidrug efflux system outer membrane protein